MRSVISVPALVLALLLSTGQARAELPPVVSELVIDASAEAIWSAWTERRHIEAWMVGTSSELELRVGGTWITSYEKGSSLDDESVIRNEILAFDPGRMLAMRTVVPPADFPFPNAILRTWSVLYLEPTGAAQTRVTTRMLGFGDDDESAEMRKFFECGNAYELKKLAEYVLGIER